MQFWEVRRRQRRASFGRAVSAVQQQESSNRPGIPGQPTPYGTPIGLMQTLPSTAKAMAGKLGVPWRPDLLSGTDDNAAAYQRALGTAYLQQGYDATGNMRDAFRYYYGGPNPRMWGPKTNAYADQVMGRMN